MEIKILGTGCAKCRSLEEHAIKAVKELGIEAQVIKVEDIKRQKTQDWRCITFTPPSAAPPAGRCKSPCPLATNITAIGFIGKDLGNRHRVFLNGLVYTAGQAISYAGVALIFYFGTDQLKISGWLQQYGEKLFGPVLIVIGLFILDIWRTILPVDVRFADRFADKFEKKEKKDTGTYCYWG